MLIKQRQRNALTKQGNQKQKKYIYTNQIKTKKYANQARHAKTKGVCYSSKDKQNMP